MSAEPAPADPAAADGSAKPNPSAEPDPAGVSFTDTNAETGATGKGTTASTMADLMGALKKQKTESSNNNDKDSAASSKFGGEKKKKKKGKKNKYVRRHDRYESDNYLLRNEGTVCCGAIISGMCFVLYNVIVLVIVIIWSKDEGLKHMHNLKKVEKEEKN